MVLLIISIVEIKKTISNNWMLNDCSINILKYAKVGIIIGNTRMLDIPDPLPIVNALPVIDKLIIVKELANNDNPTLMEFCKLLSKITILNINEIIEIDNPNDTQWMKILQTIINFKVDDGCMKICSNTPEL